jgi:hypothetical protein
MVLESLSTLFSFHKDYYDSLTFFKTPRKTNISSGIRIYENVNRVHGILENGGRGQN